MKEKCRKPRSCKQGSEQKEGTFYLPHFVLLRAVTVFGWEWREHISNVSLVAPAARRGATLEFSQMSFFFFFLRNLEGGGGELLITNN